MLEYKTKIQGYDDVFINHRFSFTHWKAVYEARNEEGRTYFKPMTDHPEIGRVFVKGNRVYRIVSVKLEWWLGYYEVAEYEEVNYKLPYIEDEGHHGSVIIKNHSSVAEKVIAQELEYLLLEKS